jgi:predicted small lipoprotein YifL
LKVARDRRSFFSLALVLAAGGLGAACGVKGPLYLPEEPDPESEKDKQKQKDAEKISQRGPAPAPSRTG